MKRFGHGPVLGKFYPFHAGHQLLIRTASAQCERLTVQVLANSAETVPLDVRVAWIREEHPGVNLVGGMDEAEVLSSGRLSRSCSRGVRARSDPRTDEGRAPCGSCLRTPNRPRPQIG